MTRIHALLPLITGVCVAAALAVLIFPGHGRGGHQTRTAVNVAATQKIPYGKRRPHVVTNYPPRPRKGPTRSQSVSATQTHTTVTQTTTETTTKTLLPAATRSPARRPSSVARELGQLVISTYSGTTPPAAMLAAVREGHTGAIILMGDNTAGGLTATRAAVDELQQAARAGGNPGLLIMTDQEGGEVKRLVGAPNAAAAGMSNPAVAFQQGEATAQLLRQAGVNLDLAPVADVTRTDGFMTQEQRTFGDDPRRVAAAACEFAAGLAREGIGYTLKHFPGLGDAIDSTDNVPVAIDEPAAEIRDDDLPYRDCGRDPLASVMVSSASYTQLTGATPAVLSPQIYHQVMPSDGIQALTMSDSFESGAIDNLAGPARTALNAGLDMIMYPDYEAASATAYSTLLADADDGSLSTARVREAAQTVLAYKQQLGLTR